jgi:hypothetical protein
MANLIVISAQWGDKGKSPPEAPHGEVGERLMDYSSSRGPAWPI